MEDPDGNTTTELHPGLVDELQEFIQFPDDDEDEVATGAAGTETE